MTPWVQVSDRDVEQIVIPQVQVSDCVVEQIVAVPQILEHSVEVIQENGQEQVSECVADQNSAQHILAQSFHVMKEIRQERVSERALVPLTQEQAVVAPAHGIMEDAVAGVQTDSVVPQIMEGIVERVQLVYDSLVLQITEEILDSVQFVDVGAPPCLRSRRTSWTVCSSWMWVPRASDHGGNLGQCAGCSGTSNS